jgi:hypothetical protein
MIWKKNRTNINLSSCWLSMGAPIISFTLHAPDGTRLVGFDNAHSVPARGSRFKHRPEASDHWHRTESDPGRPYAFKDADILLQDFFREVRTILADRGIPETVVKVEDERK